MRATASERIKDEVLDPYGVEGHEADPAPHAGRNDRRLTSVRGGWEHVWRASPSDSARPFRSPHAQEVHRIWR